MPRNTKTAERPKVAEHIRQTCRCVMVIFGATGDLTSRKLLPALYNLAAGNLLSQEFAIVGVGRRELSTERFREAISGQMQKFATHSLDSGLREWLLRRLYYVKGDLEDPQLYSRLAASLAEID